ncbi:hypothetical protein OG21DRAFT_1267857 [Imleria badia]|nr:hypothetical protein OG21DRAFT_1267857 [Imleria badia]
MYAIEALFGAHNHTLVQAHGGLSGSMMLLTTVARCNLYIILRRRRRPSCRYQDRCRFVYANWWVVNRPWCLVSCRTNFSPAISTQTAIQAQRTRDRQPCINEVYVMVCFPHGRV